MMSAEGPSLIDRGVESLDSWTTERHQQIDLFPIEASHRRNGYLARVTYGERVRWVAFVVNDRGDLESTPATDAAPVVPPRRRHRRSLAARAAVLPLLLGLAVGCGEEGSTATDPPESSPASETTEGESSPSATESESTSQAEPDHEFPPAAECAEFAPRELPSGAAVGESREKPGFKGAPLLAWGSGTDEVWVGRGQEMLDEHEEDRRSFPYRHAEEVSGPDGTPRWVIAVGDPPQGMIMHSFVKDDCPYILWTASGLTWEEALDYAGRF